MTWHAPGQELRKKTLVLFVIANPEYIYFSKGLRHTKLDFLLKAWKSYVLFLRTQKELHLQKGLEIKLNSQKKGRSYLSNDSAPHSHYLSETPALLKAEDISALSEQALWDTTPG